MHVDLICWIAFIVQQLEKLSLLYGDGLHSQFRDEYQSLLKDIDRLHWDDQQKAYADISINNAGTIQIFMTLFYVLNR